MKLNNLVKTVFIKSVRVGRGKGSGLGKACGRGQCGQGQRGTMKPSGFEGGQTSIRKRLPCRGGYKGYNTVQQKLFVINAKFLEGMEANIDILKEKLKIPFYYKRMKVIGEGKEKFFNGKIVKISYRWKNPEKIVA